MNLHELKQELNGRRTYQAKTLAEVYDTILENVEVLDFKALSFPEVKVWREKMQELDPTSEEYKDLDKKINKKRLTRLNYKLRVSEELIRVSQELGFGFLNKGDGVYLYNATYWQNIDTENLTDFLRNVALKTGVPNDTAKDVDFIKDNLHKQFKSMISKYNTETQKTICLNLLNGTLEITPHGRTLRPPRPEDYLFYQLQYEYDPQAQAPIFKKYLNEVLPNIDTQKVLAEYSGSIFIKNNNRDYKPEKALLLYGSGANGKSVFFDVFTALLGKENTANYSLESLTTNPTTRHGILGKLVNYCPDISNKFNPDTFKILASGEPIEVKELYKNEYPASDYAKLMFNANELPISKEKTEALYRRLIIIPFKKTIPKEQRDQTLTERIAKNELAGVLNWILEGLDRFIQQKGNFSHSMEIEEELNAYKLNSDSVKLFLVECNYQPSTKNIEIFKNIYFEYKNYCNDSGLIELNKINFSKRIQGNGYELTNGKGNIRLIYIEKKPDEV